MSDSLLYKFVVILNKELESGVAINAAAHMALGLVAKAKENQRKEMFFLDFKDVDGVSHYPISGLSLIVLRGKNNELKKFIASAREQNLLFVDFLQTMTGQTYKEQLEKTSQVMHESAVYYGITAFGLKEILDPLTKRFFYGNNIFRIC